METLTVLRAVHPLRFGLGSPGKRGDQTSCSGISRRGLSSGAPGDGRQATSSRPRDCFSARSPAAVSCARSRDRRAQPAGRDRQLSRCSIAMCQLGRRRQRHRDRIPAAAAEPNVGQACGESLLAGIDIMHADLSDAQQPHSERAHVPACHRIWVPLAWGPFVRAAMPSADLCARPYRPAPRRH